MNKIVLWAVPMIIGSSVLDTQAWNFPPVIADIAANNKELKAYQGYMQSRDLSNRTLNSIDGLEISGAYLPLGNHDTPHYSEFEISQSFEFPSVYRTRSAYMEQDRLARETEYLRDRQSVLAKASATCIHLVYYQKKRVLELERSMQARQVYEQVEELYRLEQVGKLDLNKARLAWLQQQFSTEHIDAEIVRLVKDLEGLNGGLPVAFEAEEYWGNLAIEAMDSLWLEKLAVDPAVRFHKESEKTAQAYVAVEKKARLPEFDIGLNYEGVRGENYAGFSGGLSIPVWNKRNNVKAAEAQYLFEVRQTDALTAAMYAEFSADYRQYSYLLLKYNEYQASLGGLDSRELLLKAYELGQISYLEYHLEMTFYQDAYDEMLIMERDLHLLRSQLLKHQL
jgi:outer membrane protein TolC